MPKASYKGDRGINPHGAPAQFLEEERFRGKLPGGSLVTPRPHFAQPDNGTHTEISVSLDIEYPLTSQRMKSGNVETDLNGGLY